MKKQDMYICDTCGRAYLSREACLVCEAKHRTDCWIKEKRYEAQDEHRQYPAELVIGFGATRDHETRELVYRRKDLENIYD